VRRWSMWGTPERVPDAADIRRAIPLRRGLRGGYHDDAGLCSLVQGRTAALRLSKRVSLCRDAIHHAVTPRLSRLRIAAPAAAGRDAAGERRRVAHQTNVSTASGSPCSVGAPGERDHDDGGRLAPFLTDVKPCIAERSAQRREPRFWPLPQKKSLTKWGALGLA
jgi:hypothetical protein